MSKPNPHIDEYGVPWCSNFKCEFYTPGNYGCELTGTLVRHVCEPVVRDMADAVVQANDLADSILNTAERLNRKDE